MPPCCHAVFDSFPSSHGPPQIVRESARSESSPYSARIWPTSSSDSLQLDICVPTRCRGVHHRQHVQRLIGSYRVVVHFSYDNECK